MTSRAITKEFINIGLYYLDLKELILISKYCSFEELFNDMLTLDVATVTSKI